MHLMYILLKQNLINTMCIKDYHLDGFIIEKQNPYISFTEKDDNTYNYHMSKEVV